MSRRTRKDSPVPVSGFDELNESIRSAENASTEDLRIPVAALPAAAIPAASSTASSDAIRITEIEDDMRSLADRRPHLATHHLARQTLTGLQPIKRHINELDASEPSKAILSKRLANLELNLRVKQLELALRQEVTATPKDTLESAIDGFQKTYIDNLPKGSEKTGFLAEIVKLKKGVKKSNIQPTSAVAEAAPAQSLSLVILITELFQSALKALSALINMLMRRGSQPSATQTPSDTPVNHVDLDREHREHASPSPRKGLSPQALAQPQPVDPIALVTNPEERPDAQTGSGPSQESSATPSRVDHHPDL